MFRLKQHIIILLYLFTCSCTTNIQKENDSFSTKTTAPSIKGTENDSTTASYTINTPQTTDSLSTTKQYTPVIQSPDSTDYAKMLKKLGHINIHSIDSTIEVEIMYATNDNFLGKDLYNGFNACYLQKDVAIKLSEAQKIIKSTDPRLSIIVYDGTRPRSIQRQMWDEVDMPYKEKKKFLAKPEILSLHNFGAAVDVSLTYKGKPIDMGTDFDHAGELAYPSLEKYYLSQGILKQHQIANRELLRESMVKAGFIYNLYEWWHFSSCKRNLALVTYPIIDNFDSYSIPERHLAASIDTAGHVTFKVQLSASARKLPRNHKIFTLKDVSYYKHNNMYKYTSGSFKELGKAYTYRDSILDNVYDQAFIVCFHKGNRIHIQEAIALLE